MADRELCLTRLKWSGRIPDQWVSLKLPEDCERVVWTSGPKYYGDEARMDVVYVAREAGHTGEHGGAQT